MERPYAILLVLGCVVSIALVTAGMWLPRSWYRAIFYPGGRPSWLTGRLNSAWGRFHALGVLPSFLVSLEAKGRRTGKVSSRPMVVAEVGGERYLVSMLGEKVDWVQNVRAANGEAVLRHGTVERVTLEEIPVAERAPILKAYVARAPGGRPHFDVPSNAPLSAFDRIAVRYPVFRVRAQSTQHVDLAVDSR